MPRPLCGACECERVSPGAGGGGGGSGQWLSKSALSLHQDLLNVICASDSQAVLGFRECPQ